MVFFCFVGDSDLCGTSSSGCGAIMCGSVCAGRELLVEERKKSAKSAVFARRRDGECPDIAT